MQLTQAQQQAIEADNRELLVSAAAGSGKTAVLIERILHMVATRELSIDHMLIVTFTRAAASELRERLELRLSEAAQQNPMLQRQAELAANAHISTIDAFCQQVVRQNFQHCRIDPQFTMGDERSRALLYDESMEEVLDWLYENAKEDAELASLVRKFTEREIITMLSQLYSFLMSRPDPMEWLNLHACHEWQLQTINTEPMMVAFMDDIALTIVGIESVFKEAQILSQDPNFPEPLKTTVAADWQIIHGLDASCHDGMIVFLRELNRTKFPTIARCKPQTDVEERIVVVFKDYRQRYKDMISDLKKLLPSDCEESVRDMQKMQPATRGLAKLAMQFHERFCAKKRDGGMVDFNDVEHMTLSILEDEELRAQQANLFDAVFVDEYQDVSALQEAILNRLKRNVENTRKQHFFYVGDVKQSIYRFRLAEPTLFLQKLESFSTDETAMQRRIILNKNFRSRTAVLNSVNRVFSHVMNSAVTEIDYDADAMLYPGVQSQQDPYTELHLINKDGIRAADLVLCEAQEIARDIMNTVGMPVLDAQGSPSGVLHYRDIAILSPVGKGVMDKVEKVLLAAGIPVYCDSSKNSMMSEELTQLLQHLLLIDNLMADVSLISELRSPLFELTEQELSRIRLKKPERNASFLAALRCAAEDVADFAFAQRCARILETLEHERFLYNSMSPDEYLWDFLTRSGLYIHYGAQPGGKLRQANLRMLCHRAGEYAKTHTDGLYGFLESVAKTSGVGEETSPTVINPWEDVVRVMTIHKSKGLEFPTVYVMGLGGSLLRRAGTKTFRVHSKVGFGLSYVNEQARTKRMTLLQGAVDIVERNEERAERARLLYVAMTRPKNRLVMIGSISAKNIGFVHAVSMLENGYDNSGDVFMVSTAKSMLEWLVQSLSQGDMVEDWGDDAFSIDQVRKDDASTQLTTEPTSFPQKSTHWRVVFHSAPVVAIPLQNAKFVNGEITELSNIFVQGEKSDEKVLHMPLSEKPWVDPIAPKLMLIHRPLKIGVTALCRAMEENSEPSLSDTEEDTPRLKSNPMVINRPRLLPSLPTVPSFLLPKSEQIATTFGVQTHQFLGLMNLDGIRESKKSLLPYLETELVRMHENGILTKEQAKQIDLLMIIRFLESKLGVRMLMATTVKREWSFTLKISEPIHTIVQGVIDLCFLENDKWVLVDFKTDRVQNMQELKSRYGQQLAFYRLALTHATPYLVGESLLYSLRLDSFCEAETK